MSNATFEYEYSHASRSYVIWRVEPSLVAGAGPTRTSIGYVASLDEVRRQFPSATERSLVLPIVHLNGTSKNSLVEQYSDAHLAVQDAIKSLQQNSPNARDYYLKPGLWERATAQHIARMTKLAEVAEELRQMVEGIDALGRR